MSRPAAILIVLRPSLRLGGQRNRLHAVKEHVRIALQSVEVEIESVQVREQLAQGRAGLQGSQVRTQAEVDPVAEREVLAERTVDPEAIGVFELARIPVSRRQMQDHCRALRDARARNLDVIEGLAEVELNRR